MRTLLDPESVARGLRRMAGEIVERHAGAPDLVLVAIRRGGIAVAAALRHWLGQLEPHAPLLGSLDITLYRDDASTALPNPRIGPSEIPCSLDGRHVILVDDVLYTGRTVRAGDRRADGLWTPTLGRARGAGRSRRPRAADSGQLRAEDRNREERRADRRLRRSERHSRSGTAKSSPTIAPGALGPEVP